MRLRNSNTVVIITALVITLSLLSVSSIASPTVGNVDRDVSIPVSETDSVIVVNTPQEIGSNEDSTRFATITNNFGEQVTVTLTLTNSQSELQEVGFGQLSQNSITVTIAPNEQRDVFVTTSNKAGNNIVGPITYITTVETSSGSTFTIGERDGPTTRQGNSGGGNPGNGNGPGNPGNGNGPGNN